LFANLLEELGVMTKEDCLAPLTFASYSYDDFHLADAVVRLPPL
jgi:8-oxo-dGTP diphosphatase